MKWYVALCFVVLGSFAQACTSSVDVDKAKLKARPVGCVTGKILPCKCSDGIDSHQRCNIFGRYDPCACDSIGFGNAAGTGG